MTSWNRPRPAGGWEGPRGPQAAPRINPLAARSWEGAEGPTREAVVAGTAVGVRELEGSEQQLLTNRYGGIPTLLTSIAAINKATWQNLSHHWAWPGGWHALSRAQKALAFPLSMPFLHPSTGTQSPRWAIHTFSQE